MRILVILGGLLLNLCCHADPYLLFREKDKIGIKDDAGKILIPATFDALGWSDGSFSVVSGVTGYKLDKQWGLINLKKELLTKPDYEQLTWSGGDRIIVQKRINAVKSSVGCLDLKGKVTVPFRYDGIKINGVRGIVFIHDRGTYRYGLIDLNGTELIPAKYEAIRPVGANRYLVENAHHKMALFSDAGRPVLDFQLDSVSEFRDGYAVIYRDALRGVLNNEGEVVAEPKYAELQRRDDGSVGGRLPDVWNILNGENKILRQCNADQLFPLEGNLYRVAKGNLYGLADAAFKTVLATEYDFLGSITDGRLVAKKNGKYGLIRRNGIVMIAFEFDSLVSAGRLVRVRRDSPGRQVWALYDTVAMRRTEKDFDFIGPFNGTVFPVRKGRYWGGLDRYGKEVMQCVYDSLFENTDGVIAVGFMGQYGIISPEEKWLVAPQAVRAHPVRNDLFWEVIDSTFFLKALSGSTIYFTRNRIEIRPDDLLEISPDGAEKHIDFQGRVTDRISAMQMAQPQKIYPASEGLRGIRKDGKYGFVDERGRLRIANRYDGIGSFSEGLAAVKILSKWGYINHAENIVVQPVYDWAEDFAGERARVRKNNRFGIIDKEGKGVLPIRYDSIVPQGREHYRIYSGKLAGLADHQGRILVDTRYDHVEPLENGYCLISRDGKYGLITLQGLSTIPLWYDQLFYDKSRNEFVGVVRSSWKQVAPVAR